VTHIAKSTNRTQKKRLSLFAKVILVNSVMLIGEALAGLWVTSHNLESHHYLIDTSFIVAAALFTLCTNTFLLRASFRPLFHLLTTIREISTGNIQARAMETVSTPEVDELARAFNGMLDRLEALRQEQTMLILQAQEEERRRIALELHDEAGQNLTALLVHMELLSQNLQAPQMSAAGPAECQRLQSDIKQLIQLTQHTLENIRLLSQQLRPRVLDDLGLLAALRWLVEDSRQRLHLNVTLTVEAEGRKDFPKLPSTYDLAIFRIAQESLTNVARHAQTDHASVTLVRHSSGIDLQVSDSGCGYNLSQHQKSLGVVGMRERAHLLKGTLAIHTRPGGGTTIQAMLPLPDEHTTIVEDTIHVN
jgi:two-component system, NarL family, sensor histidine kinase UhpB